MGIHHFIVGEATIESARMINVALPGQILVGSFLQADAYIAARTMAP